MKNLIYFSVLLCTFLLALSCSDKSGSIPDVITPYVKPDINKYTLTTDDTISLHKFQTWVNDWNTYGKSYTNSTLTTSFTLPLVDLTEFLENKASSGRDSVVAARFYLGLRRDTTPNMPHLLLVGVNSVGDSLTNAADKQYIYDVSKPCPTLCHGDSLPDKK